ncbi:hypothetical protein VIOR3934_07333 [Vibrio orientalis CIP 102891 = ATCC 33934]|uniref:Nuclear transport factor 2 family protein n=1 Tax=Vibrio orientalis CIP 102891 = ATCC 33934 TaxID=675816 RepID=C9QLT9_VIBOR|nr:nuclear transport factor 2 family protein [Vibrio orientalis]EEX92866.1 hypothetical protein VIA_003511 [Vibrio orientalis CIP 102891 = ATCC 33934]EGU46547.1 hypothetical protein VIOR3934_07333 [Vibrio orientalis CIP 102891 = ATCC 33934]
MCKQQDQADFQRVTDVVQRYFTGLHHGDSQLLSSIFHPDAYLKAPQLRRGLAEWLSLVEQRAKPIDNGDSFDYQILSIDVIGQQAMVKVLCPLLGRTYIDFLGLLYEDQQWRIVNKMYADIE